VGAAACRLLLGDLDAALAGFEYASKHGGSESILGVWLGETLRRLGRPKEAVAWLRTWKQPLPFRPPLWLNLALALEDLGEKKEAARILAGLRRHLPGFMEDAAKAAGGRATSRDVLEAALASMRGNRSSWMYTYYGSDGKLRTIPIRGVAAADVPAGLRGYYASYYGG
jgi:predicted Zn-dependent protease